MMRFLAWIVLSNFVCVPFCAAADDLAQSTWESPSHEAVQTGIENWLVEANIDEVVADQIRQQWEEPINPAQRLNLLANSFALTGGELSDLMNLSQGLMTTPTLPDVAFLEDSTKPDFQRHHAKLIFARWLAQNELYNETLDQLASTTTEDVVDPASLLFYQSIANHRLLKKDECLPIVARLLEKEETLPKRFAILAAMIREDIKPLEPDSLDEISRLMDSIKVRLGHGRAGKRVRTEEDDVIAKLDKMIKKLEDQAKAQQASAGAGGAPGGTLNPNKPMEDSMPGGGTGEGNVDAKNIGAGDGWGDLPPKERQQALQQLGKDFPSHYRDVIEEYFRKLAKEGSDP